MEKCFASMMITGSLCLQDGAPLQSDKLGVLVPEAPHQVVPEADHQTVRATAGLLRRDQRSTQNPGHR